MNKATFGKLGEDLACQYLKRIGYIIMERNFRIRGGEIDIISVDEQTLVYVEVKTRTSRQFGYPEEAVTPYKIRFLKRAAKFYRIQRRNLHLPSLERIDVVSVDLFRGKPSFKIIKNAGF